jgi:hypothetical protein
VLTNPKDCKINHLVVLNNRLGKPSHFDTALTEHLGIHTLPAAGYSRLMGEEKEATHRTLSSYRKLID